MSEERYPVIDDLVPHGPPMRVLEELLDWAPGRARCRLSVRAHAPFVRAGKVASVVGLEYMAQAVAACLGYEAYLSGGRVRVGMIVGVRKMDLLEPSFSVGDDVVIDVERVRGDDEVSSFNAEAKVDGRVVCSAQLTLVHPEQPPK